MTISPAPLSTPAPATTRPTEATPLPPWWRDAVIYQVYVRSFRDSTGDGVGDLEGVRAGLPYLKRLGVDGLWLTPFYPSPQRDHGYDVADYRDVDPAYGDLAAFDRLIADAHRIGLRCLVDVVPNHCSSEHPWFRQALREGPGGGMRKLFHFAEGRGECGELPPNNWHAMFGGPAWTRVTEPDGTPGQWYLHLFTPDQPDLNWRHPDVAEHFEDVLRFWLDRGVDGFRVDVAVGLFKHPDLPDSDDPAVDERTHDARNPLAWNQPEVHDIWRRWREIGEQYTARDGRERLLVGEVSVPTPAEQAAYVGPDEFHQAFFFHLLNAPWDAEAFREVITGALDDIAVTGSTVTWVLNNHDIVRTVTRYAAPATPDDPAPHLTPELRRTGADRARAGALLMLALPGASYLYQGEELGLPEVTDLPDELITDPVFHRTGSRYRIRDGCRIPLPWTGEAAPFGFSGEPAETWLPQPEWFAEHTAERAQSDTGSFWHLYRDALHLRRTLAQLGEGPLRWLPSGAQVLAFARGEGLVCAVNFGDTPAPAPAPGTPLLSSGPCPEGVLPPNTAGWWSTSG
ncbi:glycoside hydrolase family 13 protein [Streptomyces endophyticus]|uniref:Glycoside hydrolase family 13 protein n=1 Tax=Streptomyces endophyticus TaxID=714166 RepID=A0ABU6EWR7_9ACTN|nr:glycoside hydrolase family 13 protein [Streptomyces endophyticus]MEB8336049.1 glycoside hydrolase family 13 protein [Streptomyces endophyticus]